MLRISKRGPQTGGAGITWELSGNADPQPRAPESESALSAGQENKRNNACSVRVTLSSTKTGPFFEAQSRRVRTLSDTSHLSFLPLGSPLPGMSQGL